MILASVLMVVVEVVVESSEIVEGLELAIGGKAPHSVTLCPLSWFLCSKASRSKERSKHQPLSIRCAR